MSGIKVKILNKFLFLFTYFLHVLSPKLFRFLSIFWLCCQFALPPYRLVFSLHARTHNTRDRLDLFAKKKNIKLSATKCNENNFQEHNENVTRFFFIFASPYIFLVNLSQSVDAVECCFWSVQLAHEYGEEESGVNPGKNTNKNCIAYQLSCHMFLLSNETECLAISTMS